MFVYSDDTSIDTKRQSFGSFSFFIRFMNEVESFMYDGNSFT